MTSLRSADTQCALRALSMVEGDREDDGCLALPCACDLERADDELRREAARRHGHVTLPRL
jgi:hypothetical protein